LAGKYTTYKLDEDTEELFSQMMNFAQRFIDLQIDEETYRELQDDLDELGRRFDIHKSDVEFRSETEDDPETGETTVKITFKTETPPRVKTPEEIRKNLRLISNDEDDDEPTKH
tara:strand:+ start:43 stop:384 length:342 start_codon:yes stop_codon:yes gene_type:complete